MLNPLFIRTDPSNVTFESVFNHIEDINVPFETGYSTIRQLAFVKPRLYAKLFEKVVVKFHSTLFLLNISDFIFQFDGHFSAHREFRFQDSTLFNIVQV